MRLATVRTTDGTAAARLDGDPAAGATYTLIEGCEDVSELLSDPEWREIAAAADGAKVPAGDAELATLLPAPGKVLCAGLNYATHIREMGQELPEYPTLFAKFADTLTGPYDDVVAPDEDPKLDWECELGLVIGQDAYRVAEDDAAEYIAGYTVVDDVSMRGFQRRTGDLVLTGTPGGVGVARDPQVFLRAGDVVEVSIAGLGRLENRIVAPLG